MQFDSLAAFFAMGGHALYVWLAYGATFVVLLFSWLSVKFTRRKQWQRLQWQVQVNNQQSTASSSSADAAVGENEPQT